MGIHWRTDGTPLWGEPSLLADPHDSGTANVDDARSVMAAVAQQVDLDDSFVMAAYEDLVASDVDDGPTLGPAVGFVLPIRPPEGAAGKAGWSTSQWTFGRGRLFLLPGDSPIGLRLPLSAVMIDDTPPTALAVELRHGRLHVFLPPLERADDFVVLVTAVESAAARVGVAVVLEGYPPPPDPRLTQLVVTPDPGVIEVNVPPATTWDDMVAMTVGVAADARACRLGTEKFDLDGQHWGTGGGNHLTLGGATPVDSPVLRRPDLLASLVLYWQHHPSLSYLFAGRFIGPTSQAPRVDEGRVDLLDELELAFAELDRLQDDAPRPWLVDRIFRNLLTDVSGNTHRAEFCIDKLYSPDSERGRLGLVELRAFEMPPHPQMALVQALLVRAIVARMWADPYRGPVVRWGTELHDRFLLPHEVACDIADVVDDLRAHGFAFEHAWLDPFIEFRFPQLGEADVAGIHLELRAAIEPWLVLGEETASGATARYVDSSLERLQVIASGMVEGRHVITCNGVPVPVRPARGAPGWRVGGVRYRAWQPPTALHPTIGVHSPLVFEVIDRWNGQSLGGCTYHVVHPGGLSYETFPVNAAEAEARRASRFEPFGQVPGSATAVAAMSELVGRSGGRYPRTLDLRQGRPS
jgi:uncharacterized protein (DUF2126 family)